MDVDYFVFSPEALGGVKTPEDARAVPHYCFEAVRHIREQMQTQAEEADALVTSVLSDLEQLPTTQDG